MLVSAIALPFVINGDQFRPEIQTKLSAMLGREITIGHLDLSAVHGNLKAADISISDDPAFSSAPFVRAQSLEVGIDLIPLIFSHTLHIRSIELQNPQVVLLRSASGQWNFSSIGQHAKGKTVSSDVSAGPAGTPEFMVQALKIVDGKLKA